jgi:hypothetical protein
MLVEVAQAALAISQAKAATAAALDLEVMAVQDKLVHGLVAAVAAQAVLAAMQGHLLVVQVVWVETILHNLAQPTDNLDSLPVAVADAVVVVLVPQQLQAATAVVVAALPTMVKN